MLKKIEWKIWYLKCFFTLWMTAFCSTGASSQVIPTGTNWIPQIKNSYFSNYMGKQLAYWTSISGPSPPAARCWRRSPRTCTTRSPPREGPWWRASPRGRRAAPPCRSFFGEIKVCVKIWIFGGRSSGEQIRVQGRHQRLGLTWCFLGDVVLVYCTECERCVIRKKKCFVEINYIMCTMLEALLALW